MKFAESLQEMINYHTVRCHRVKPDVFSFVRLLFPLKSWGVGEGGGEGGRQSSAGLMLRSSSLTVTRLLLLLGKAATGRERGNGSVVRRPSAGRGKMTEHLQKCHGDFEQDNCTLTAFLVLFAETNLRFPKVSSMFLSVEVGGEGIGGNRYE